MTKRQRSTKLPIKRRALRRLDDAEAGQAEGGMGLVSQVSLLGPPIPPSPTQSSASMGVTTTRAQTTPSIVHTIVGNHNQALRRS